MKLGPNNPSEELIFAEENLRVDVQHCIVSAMNKLNVTRSQLAKRLGTSEQHVSQLFSSNANPTIKTLARIFFALGDECFVSSKHLDRAAHERQIPCNKWVMVERVAEDASRAGAQIYGWSNKHPVFASTYKQQSVPYEELTRRSA